MNTNKDLKTKTSQRFRILEGQLRGIEDMVYNDKNVVDVVMQISAFKRALSSLEDLLLEYHLSVRLAHELRAGSGKTEQATKEILKIYSLKR